MQSTNLKIKNDTVLFFDLDGTLVDTNLANFLAYKKAINSVMKVDHNLIYDPQKRFNRSNLKSTVPNLSRLEYDQIIEEKERVYTDFLPEAKLNKEIANILLTYSKTNTTVLVTNCRRNRVLTTLSHFGLTEKFSEIFCREAEHNDKKVNKFQLAISKLGVQPNFVVVFENEENEIADARKAGISIINPTYL